LKEGIAEYLVEDAEDLVGIDRAEGEVVVGVFAVVEMEAAEHFQVEQPGDNLLDILRLIMVAGIDENESLGAGRAGEFERHAPVGDIGVVEGGFEGLVFDKQPLVGGEGSVGLAEYLFHPNDAIEDALGAGVVRAVGDPGRDVACVEALGDFDAIEQVAQGASADLRIGIADGAVFVLLRLKEVRIDRAGADGVFSFQLLDDGRIGNAIGEVPLDMEGEGWVDAGESVDLGGVGEFFFDGSGGCGLKEFAETGSGIGESPGGYLDGETVQRVGNSLCFIDAVPHENPKLELSPEFESLVDSTQGRTNSLLKSSSDDTRFVTGGIVDITDIYLKEKYGQVGMQRLVQ